MSKQQIIFLLFNAFYFLRQLKIYSLYQQRHLNLYKILTVITMCIAIMILILFTTDFLSYTENTALIY